MRNGEGGLVGRREARLDGHEGLRLGGLGEGGEVRSEVGLLGKEV